MSRFICCQALNFTVDSIYLNLSFHPYHHQWSPDTLLNVFLAIAVDNLTNAQEIGDDEKAEQQEREKHKQEIKEKYAPKGRG